MTRTYRITKDSFVKQSNKTKQGPTNKIPCHCNKCKGRIVDPCTEKKHNLKKDLRPRGVIDNIQYIDLNQGLSDDPNQNTPVDLSNDPMEVELSDDDNYREIERIHDGENYSFLTKPRKGISRGKQKDSGSKNVTYPIVLIEQNISDYDASGSDDGEDDQYDDDFDFIEERPNEYSSSGFDAPENTYDDDPEIPIIDFSVGFHWIILWILLY